MQVCMCSVEVELPLQEGDLFWRLMPFRRKVSGGSLVLFPCTAHPDSSRTWSLSSLSLVEVWDSQSLSM